MIGAYEKFTANTGMNRLQTANTGLDGGGTIYTILTAASSGTYIKTISIKSQTSLCSGDMVRLFIMDAEDEPLTLLLKEVLVRPAGGGIGSTFATYGITIPINITLKSGWSLRASTNIAGKISVVAEGLNWVYP